VDKSKITGVVLLSVAMIFIGIGFQFLPQVFSATASILAYNYTGATSTFAQTANFTGLTAFTPQVPLLVVLGFIMDVIIAGFLGLRVVTGRGDAHLGTADYLISGIALLFVGIGLTFYTNLLDGVSASLWNGGSGLSTTTYAAARSLLLITPMLSLLAFVVAVSMPAIIGTKALLSG